MQHGSVFLMAPKFLNTAGKRWKYLSHGSYNFVYQSEDKTEVLKIRKRSAEKNPEDAPERSVRIWNEINQNISPQARIVESLRFGNATLNAWTCPFVEGEQATDRQIVTALIDIYNRTGRIIVDAISRKNFIATPSGRVICIDVGAALAIELEETKAVVEHMGDARRRRSIVSQESWKHMQEKYNKYFAEHADKSPETIKVIKALLFIRTHRPGILNIDFLKNKPKLINTFANAYDKPLACQLHDFALLEFAKPSLLTIKRSCKTILQRYIASRGIFEGDKFEPSLGTYLFRNRELTSKKANAAKQLIERIESAVNVDDINTLVSTAIKDPELIKAFKISDLQSALAQCLIVLDISGSKLQEATPEKGDELKQKKPR